MGGPPPPTKPKRQLRVTFLHLDMGIGGAEQLVVNAAVGLQKQGHIIHIYTSHHDTSHCFAETKGQGPLASVMHVHGDFLPRQILGRFTALCAVIRMIYLAIIVGLFSGQRHDVIFCDGVSAMIPLLRLFGLPVLFYCHFPDKLLCTDRRSLLKRLYRWPLDFLEEITTGASTAIAVNSEFTAGIFKEAFTRVGPHFDPVVLYPAINLDSFVKPAANSSGAQIGPIVSLNRFERKKNIGLALEAFSLVLERLGSKAVAKKLRLVVAGGYDEAVTENKEHLEELKARAKERGLTSVVSFRPSISDEERATLLQTALCVLYTPDKEHFGIVPLEAMYAGSPVVAVASGGPLESVKDGEAGFLCPGDGPSFSEAILKMVERPELKGTMGQAGHAHVKGRFSLEAFALDLDKVVVDVYNQAMEAKRQLAYTRLKWGLALIVVVIAALVVKPELRDLLHSEWKARVGGGR